MASTPSKPSLYLVPPVQEETPLKGGIISAPPQNGWRESTAPAPWAVHLKKWGPWLAIPGVLLMASYWGSPGQPLFRR